MQVLDLTRNEFEEKIADCGLQKYRARQIMNWIYSRFIFSFDEMSDLSKKDRVLLSSVFSISTLKNSEIISSEDGTEKLVFELIDRFLIESVIIPEEKRTTLCISTQVGCPLKCSFCKTGSLGYKRNLTTGEITGQVLWASKYLSDKGKRITNIVYMGMGEPLLNFEATVKSINILLDDHGFNFSNRRITVSTVGIADKIVSLGEKTGVNLAISLHAVTDEKRNKIMGVNQKYSISDLMDAAKKYPVHPRKKVVIEYIMLKDFNDTAADAAKLLKIARMLNAKVNLIPFNRFEGSMFEPSEGAVIEKFQSILNAGKITTKIRKSRGGDTLAACGQLGRAT